MKTLLERARTQLSSDGRRAWPERVQTTLHLAARYASEVGAGRVLLRRCSEVGEGARVIGGRPRIDNQGYIGIGARSVLLCEMGPTMLRTGPRGRLVLGESSILNFGSLISANASVVIGKGVNLGQYCLISDTEGADVSPDAEALPIEIGDRAWLAARVTVLPGSRIGEGSVITAGSIVSGEIPPGVVAGGIPARVLRHLKPEQDRAAAAQQEQVVPLPEPLPAEELSPTSRFFRPRAVPVVEAAYHGYIVSDFTVGELERELNDSPGLPQVEFEAAPFGAVVPSLLSPAPEGRDVLVVWTRAQSVVPSFARLLAYESVDEAALLKEVDDFCELVLRRAASFKAVFVPTWVLPHYQRTLGMTDARKGGATRALAAMNLRLMDRLGDLPNVFVLNAQRWVESAGRNAQQPKLWYLGKVPFHADVFAEAARDIKAALSGLGGGARKLLVLDLDDTVWGGIVGDVGWENLRLGGHDGVGEAFVDFQRAASELKRRGVVLAIASKNQESVALEAMRSHPEMVLREQDFVAWRINWNDKAQNIAEIAAELKLGLQSVVFIDDNPVERARVRETLPEVFVPDWPEDKLLYPSALRALRCFDTPSLSREDVERTELYGAERQRESLKVQVGSLDDWLVSLNMAVRAARLNRSNLTRTAQLLNKTNQLNLSTRRLTEVELEAWAQDTNRELWTIDVGDRFGDAGLTGIVSLEYDGDRARIVDFVLSCRVMGRKVEETLAHIAVTSAQRRGATRVEAHYLETKKNKPCLEFLQRSGFSSGGVVFSWDTASPYPCPSAIRLTGFMES